jgi:hypothetical protein
VDNNDFLSTGGGLTSVLGSACGGSVHSTIGGDGLGVAGGGTALGTRDGILGATDELLITERGGGPYVIDNGTTMSGHGGLGVLGKDIFDCGASTLGTGDDDTDALIRGRRLPPAPESGSDDIRIIARHTVHVLIAKLGLKEHDIGSGPQPSSTLGRAFYLGGTARLPRADVVCVHQAQGPRLTELPPAPAHLHVATRDNRSSHWDNPG